MKKNCTNKSLKDFSSVAPFFVFPFHRETFSGTWDFIYSILWHFFWLQTRQKLHLSHRPVIYVDTPLDDKIPFCPEKIETYIGFIPFFIKPAWMLTKEIGLKKAGPIINEYTHYLAQMYKNAASIYRFCLTTTHRPKYLKNKHFRTIHFFDPHLLCVPSLHVSIAAGTYAFFKNKLTDDILPPEETKFRIAEIKQQAIDIIESVLFVKQHSVNCIPAALYMLTASSNGNFITINETIDLINDLFKTSPEISQDVKKEINNHFKYMFERTLLESFYSDNWQDCIKHWLLEHAEQTGQKIITKQ